MKLEIDVWELGLLGGIWLVGEVAKAYLQYREQSQYSLDHIPGDKLHQDPEDEPGSHRVGFKP